MQSAVIPKKKRFGAFMAPFHPPIDHPLLALERDLELITWLDELAFDEVWVGEHHSAGWEYIAAPEVFLAFAAERTRHIKLGTGVVSLPYHQPMLVAERMVLLDNLRVHRASSVEDAVRSARARVLWLPTYSPDFSPLESCRSKVKALVRGDEPRTASSLNTSLARALDAVTADDVDGWFRRCGY